MDEHCSLVARRKAFFMLAAAVFSFIIFIPQTASAAPALFGTQEAVSPNIHKFLEWSHMLHRFEQERAAPQNKKIVALWQSELSPFKNMTLKQQAAHVNSLINRMPYAPDEETMGKIDDWATPIEFLRRGTGDCEDFAIAKYESMKTLGFPAERMRIVVLHDAIKNMPHAVLALYTDEGIMILDNQAKKMKRDTEISTYEPIYSINSKDWWLHSRRVAAVPVKNRRAF